MLTIAEILENSTPEEVDSPLGEVLIYPSYQLRGAVDIYFPGNVPQYREDVFWETAAKVFEEAKKLEFPVDIDLLTEDIDVPNFGIVVTGNTLEENKDLGADRFIEVSGVYESLSKIETILHDYGLTI